MTQITPQSKKSKYRHATSAEDFLEQRYTPEPNSGCWLWTGPVDRNGYGQVQSGKHAIELGVTRAHQMAYVVWIGSVPKDRIICHSCDNPYCINPKHLYAGTWMSNVHDCIKRGRYRNGFEGYRHPHHDYIIQCYGSKSCMKVAEEIGISFSRVCQIWRASGLTRKGAGNGKNPSK